MTGIEAEGLSKRFGSLTAVDRLSFEVGTGEIFGLLGPNGSGKTTTVRLLSCLIAPSEGSARVAGFDIKKDPLKVREAVGVLTENPGIYDRLSALENMEFFAEAYGLSDKTERQSRIRELLEFFDLWERRNDKAGTFSKGMRQKLAIAKAVVHRPEVLFLDEPSAGLDPKAAKDIRDLMDRMSRQEKRTIVLCTHNLEEAERLCSRVMIIRKGATLATGSIEDLRRKLHGAPELEIKLDEVNDGLLKATTKLEGVKSVYERTRCTLIYNLDDPEAQTPDVVKSLIQAGGRVRSVKILRPTLEDAYLELTKERSI
ncbi:MAG: ABC transporter ATP-binding protein [Candidatus Bathyarchaeota archaeon]|nr:ABC transporter ATP-binding protein [Candidatus Bathyarchaeota archaeon]